jgi:hypothetical protein
MSESVLSYYDALLYKSDVALLEDPDEWLNDAVINYQLTRFQHNDDNIFNLAASSESYKKETVFMDPAVLSFLMHQLSSSSDDVNQDEQDEEEETNEARQALQANNIMTPPKPPSEDDVFAENVQRRSSRKNKYNCKIKQLVFFPINDSHANPGYVGSPTMAIGAHWSLLVMVIFEPYSLSFYHFDSSYHMNETAALAVAKKMAATLLNDSISSSTGSTISRAELDFHRCATPVQENENDCGVYCLAIVEILATFFLLEQAGHVDQEQEVTVVVDNSSAAALDPRQIQQQFEEMLQDTQLRKLGSKYADEYRQNILQSICIHVQRKNER